MQFNAIIGHQQLKEKLVSSIMEDRVPHAQLFVGPEGCGALQLAMAFAQRLVCTNSNQTDSCGECPACQKASKMIHPDIHYSYPSIGSKAISQHFIKEWRQALVDQPYMNVHDWLQHIQAENKQGNITKDECTNIIKKLSLKSFESEAKILLLWMPEFLAKEGNRLLKIIEEPPEQTYFLFVAEQPEQILGTILSRCQLVKVPTIKDDEIEASLIKDHGVAKETARSIAQVAEGNFRQALQMVDAKDADTAQLFLEWMRKAWKGHGVEITQIVDEIAALGRENQKYFLQYGLHFLRECLVIPWQTDDQRRLLENEAATAAKMRSVLDWQKIQGLSRLMDDCSYYVERNANPRILFMDASLQLHQIFKAS